LLEQREKLDEFLFTFNIFENLGMKLEASEYFYKGLVLFYKRDYDEFLQAFNMSLRLKPNVLDVLVNKDVVLSRLQRYDEALKVLKGVLNKRKEDADIYINLGNVYLNLKKKKKPLKHSTKPNN